MTSTSANQQTLLYRFFNSEDALLYVGITDNPGQRWEAHMRRQPWWREVSKQTAEWYGSRAAAADAEIKVIQEEKPLHNITHAAPDLPVTLAFAWTCSLCQWSTLEPEDQIAHMERELGRLVRSSRVTPPDLVERMERELGRMRQALDRFDRATRNAQAAFDRMVSARRLPRSSAPDEQILPPETANRLLSDMDLVLGDERTRLSEVPALLRNLDPSNSLYTKLTGVRLRALLRGCGVKTVTTGNVPSVDPAELRRARSSAA